MRKTQNNNTDILTRRRFLTGGGAAASALILSACSTSAPPPQMASMPQFMQRFRVPQFDRPPVFGNGVDGSGISMAQYRRIYGAMPNEQFPIPAVDLDRVPREFWRRRVPYSGGERPGTIIVDTSRFYLFHVEEGGSAMRYGVGLGRQGFEWAGRAVVQWKRPWPTWTPPDEMIERQPELAKYSADNGGMEPGLNNPLGARALYIFQNGQDTLYRIHGTPEYWTIGKAVSSGCVRMMNQDVIHLYEFVRNGSPIIVR